MLKPRFSLRLVLIATALICMVIAIRVYFSTSDLPEKYGVNVPASECPVHLPAGATNICYAETDSVGGDSAIAVEFSITRKALKKQWGVHWGVRSAGGFKKITKPESIPRFTYFLSRLFADRHAVVTNGLVAGWAALDHQHRLVFDATNRRAYYFIFNDIRPYSDWPPEQYQ